VISAAFVQNINLALKAQNDDGMHLSAFGYFVEANFMATNNLCEYKAKHTAKPKLQSVIAKSKIHSHRSTEHS